MFRYLHMFVYNILLQCLSDECQKVNIDLLSFSQYYDIASHTTESACDKFLWAYRLMSTSINRFLWNISFFFFFLFSLQRNLVHEFLFTTPYNVPLSLITLYTFRMYNNIPLNAGDMFQKVPALNETALNEATGKMRSYCNCESGK